MRAGVRRRMLTCSGGNSGTKQTMTASTRAQRRLWQCGVLLLLFGLLNGALIPFFNNPRMGLSAHLAGVQNGMLLVLFGFLWSHLTLTGGQGKLGFWSAVYGLYVIWVALVLAAVFGTSRATPIAGGGHSGNFWQETLVSVLIGTGSIAIILAVILALYGLRGRGSAEA